MGGDRVPTTQRATFCMPRSSGFLPSPMGDNSLKDLEEKKNQGPSILTYWYMWSLQFLVQDSTPPTRRAFLLFPIFHDIITYIDIRCCWPTHIQFPTPIPCLLLAKNALPEVNKTRSVNASAFRVWSMEIQCHTPITIFPLRQTIMTTSRPVNAAALRI